MKGDSMSRYTSSDRPLPEPVSVRARLRPKSQLTLPEEVRRALRVNEGDEVEFRVGESGTITVRGYVSVPSDHAWLYEPHQGTGQSSGRESPELRSTIHESPHAMFSYLDALGAADV
jgi:bifunctional DNA-binding transcriptional regulator/antitoxin component of YhaV-PrlF toxin-antitoxin module